MNARRRRLVCVCYITTRVHRIECGELVLGEAFRCWSSNVDLQESRCFKEEGMISMSTFAWRRGGYRSSINQISLATRL